MIDDLSGEPVTVAGHYARYAVHGRAMLNDRDWLVRVSCLGHVEYWQCNDGVDVRLVEAGAPVESLQPMTVCVGGRPRKVRWVA